MLARRRREKNSHSSIKPPTKNRASNADVDNESYVKKIDAQQFIEKALTPISEFNESFDHDFSDADVDTIGGLVLQHFSHIPERDESVVIGAFRFTILNGDSRQIRLLKVTRMDEETGESSK